ncbi:NAD(P)/FAD-dependent oxidoreductase [Halalkalibacter sp. APA_J-10(15)]|uniref:NAD(P)/FAD-dependent oxidoreductase n=1 Tax=Halalkalibacter sp. APA_J-10(15) TaxID=2933805 RepID=UPI001FF38E8B|nr:NAD(P)/FAD-dependent oxidoreductase [Halalkalibacter sp. APA_J-10(15)]MCK0472714.1 NAD(P)/FAD-dependent oxidoreductase [Halalkalibacter sp. APA_J-10(15)]
MSDSTNMYDITIIGGGPTGLFAAFYGGMRQAKVKIIESMPQLGGQLSALYPEKYIYDVAGFPKVRAQELVDRLAEQASQFKPTIVLEQAVQELIKQEDESYIIQTDKDTHFTKAVIITAGAGAFQPRRLEVEGASDYEGKNLHYFIRDLSAFAGQNVIVCGGGDSAVDWSLMLEPIAKEVTLIHRRDKFRAHEHSLDLLKKSNVKVLTPFQIQELIGDGEAIHQVKLAEIKGSQTHTLDVDSVIVNFGFVSSLGPIKKWGLDIERNAIKVNTKMETNLPGIYAAGDVCTYEGKVKLIATGFGEAPTAINNAKTYIDPTAKVFPGHSTSLF